MVGAFSDRQIDLLCHSQSAPSRWSAAFQTSLEPSLGWAGAQLNRSLAAATKWEDFGPAAESAGSYLLQGTQSPRAEAAWTSNTQEPSSSRDATLLVAQAADGRNWPVVGRCRRAGNKSLPLWQPRPSDVVTQVDPLPGVALANTLYASSDGLPCVRHRNSEFATTEGLPSPTIASLPWKGAGRRGV